MEAQKIKRLGFFIFLLILSSYAVSAATIRGDTEIYCDNDWGNDRVQCGFYQPPIRCDNYLGGVVLYFRGVTAEYINENYITKLWQFDTFEIVQAVPNTVEGDYAMFYMKASATCFDYPANEWVSFNIYGDMSGAFDFTKKSNEPPTPSISVFEGEDRTYSGSISPFIESYDNIHHTTSYLDVTYSNPLSFEYYGDTPPVQREYNEVISGWEDGKEISREKYDGFWYWVTYPVNFYSLECTYMDKKDCACEGNSVKCTYCNSMGFWEEDKSILYTCNPDFPVCFNLDCVECVEDLDCGEGYVCSDTKCVLEKECIYTDTKDCACEGNEIKCTSCNILGFWEEKVLSESCEGSLPRCDNAECVECVEDLDCGEMEICSSGECVEVHYAPLKSHAIHAIETTRRNLMNSMVEADMHTEIDSVFTVSSCMSDLINFPIKNKYLKVGADVLKEAVEVVVEDEAGNALELKMIQGYFDAAENKTNPYISESLYLMAEGCDDILIDVESTEFAEEVYRTQRFAILDSSNWADKIEDLNSAYENANLAKSVIFLSGNTVLSLMIPGGGTAISFGIGLAVEYGMGVSECVIGGESSSDYQSLLASSVKDMNGKAVLYADKVREGIDYLVLTDKNDFPKIEVSAVPFELTITNVGNKSVNVDVEYEIEYFTKEFFDWVSPEQNYNAKKSIELAPGEVKIVSLESGDYIWEWIDDLIGGCSVSIEKFNLSSYYNVNVFYGEEETIALKQIEFGSRSEFECEKKFPIYKKSSGGGSSKKKLEVVENVSNYSVVEVSNKHSGVVRSSSKSPLSSPPPVVEEVVLEEVEDSPVFFSEVGDVFTKILDFFKGIFG